MAYRENGLHRCASGCGRSNGRDRDRSRGLICDACAPAFLERLAADLEAAFPLPGRNDPLTDKEISQRIVGMQRRAREARDAGNKRRASSLRGVIARLVIARLSVDRHGGP